MLAPAHAAGSVDVTVTTPGGTSATSSADKYAYDAAPTVTGLTPNNGPTAGQNTVTIKGTGFVKNATTVAFGSTAATQVTFVSATQLTATAPAGSAGTVTVTVTTPGGPSKAATANLYAYGAPTITSFKPTSGITGSTVTITGTGFVSGIGVSFGTLASAKVTVTSGTSLTAVVPNGAVAATISASDPQGTGTSTTQFQPTLSITGFTPSSGPAGTVVTINGIGFISHSTVKFNGVAATSVTFVSSTQIQATAPAGVTTGSITVTNATAPKGTVTSPTSFTAT